MPPLAQQASDGPALVGYDGKMTPLNNDEYRTMRTVLRVIKGGRDGGDEEDPRLSTGQVAEILGLSRKTVTRLLDAGKMPHEKSSGGHRSVLLSDVLMYKRSREKRAEGLAEARSSAAEAGLYDYELGEQLFSYFSRGV